MAKRRCAATFTCVLHAAKPVFRTPSQEYGQQRRFDRFRREFSEMRPHETLD